MTTQNTLPPRDGTSFADQPHAYDPVKQPQPFQGVIGKRVLAFIVDAIIITASANHIPTPLIKQLKEGGRLILPLGSTVYYQMLTLATKRKGELDVEQMSPVAFVPMVGEMDKKR